MLVEAVFWFHPLVWWIERRLVDERERACDEDVVRMGGDPRVYAEGILKTSELCVESPLVCASGITGSDLRTRIEAIMQRHPCQALGGWRRLVVWTATSFVVIAPFSLGALDVPLLRAQAPPAASAPAFDVASVKPNKSSEARASFGGRPGGQVVVVNNTLRNMIRNAYQLQEYQIVGGPDWINDDRFDINAKAANSDTPPLQLLAMVQTLLADRFKLRVHRETREVPVYALVMARDDRRLGPRLKTAAADCDALIAALGRGGTPPPSAPAGERPPCGIRQVPGRMMAGGSLLSDVGRNLAPSTGRLVIDRTGLTGRFDLDLEWTPDQMPPPPPPGAPPSVLPPPPADGPSLFAAIQEQLGLKLEATRGPVEVLVIDSAERPQPD
jgi:bla regulator protein blaR1